MQILTQRNATLIFAAGATWTTVSAAYPGLVPHPIDQWISAVLMGGGTFLVFIGYTRTQAGNIIPPSAASQIDRQAILSRAGDAVVDAAAQKVTEDAKKP